MSLEVGPENINSNSSLMLVDHMSGIRTKNNIIVPTTG